MRHRNIRSDLIHRSALGGYTIEGPYVRQRGIRRAIARIVAWLGGAR
ncbi:hypothetical protein PAN31117_04085 [Pandoraea anapnoica]|uniref:Uncharacterized protein n=1 Tax=Pandoraea anapnoica TaxID=2508301 RepID=A0A5E5AD56_9BURK|nr:hypothetical protein [Pandoraea anapnoica]VVE71529.1 hypothetical protein PAN31117_04085 [Pandoraea anapnoica]